MKEFLQLTGIATCFGALIGFGLSFTALSPLIIGGIIGCALPMFMLLDILREKLYRKENTEIKEVVVVFSIIAATGFGFGAGLGTAASALFPGIMLRMGSAALMGAIVLPISFFMTDFSAEYVILPLLEKINSNIIEPIVEKIKECFPSREEGDTV